MARSFDSRKGMPLPTMRGANRQSYGRLIPGDDIEVVREIERIWAHVEKNNTTGNVNTVNIGSVTEIVTNITTGILGGATDQVLTKVSGADYDYDWEAASGGGSGTWTGEYLAASGASDDLGVTDVTFVAFAAANCDTYVITDYDARQAAGDTLQMQLYGFFVEGQIIQLQSTLNPNPFPAVDTTGAEDAYRTTMGGNPGWNNVDFGVQGGTLTITLERKNSTAAARDYSTTSYKLRHRWVSSDSDVFSEYVTAADISSRFYFGHYKSVYAGASGSFTANYTPLYTDDLLNVDTSGGSFSITLPVLATDEHNGKRLIVKKLTSDTNTCTINPNAAETIDGASTYVIRKQYEAVTFWNDFGEWKIESAYPKKAGLTMNWQGTVIPIATGTSGGVWIVPLVDGVSVTFDITQTRFRCETAPTTGPTTVVIEKSNGGGAFSASTVDTLTLATGVYEDDNTPGGTITSGQVARINFTALGAGAAVYTVDLIGKEQ